eukprot:1332807-Amorphochlora_amoeboformis.AAC.1
MPGHRRADYIPVAVRWGIRCVPGRSNGQAEGDNKMGWRWGKGGGAELEYRRTKRQKDSGERTEKKQRDRIARTLCDIHIPIFGEGKLPWLCLLLAAHVSWKRTVKVSRFRALR